jgi:methyl-accepting chemotaxis protein
LKSVRNKLFAGFGLVVIIFLVLAVVVNLTLQGLSKDVNYIKEQEVPLLISYEKLAFNISDRIALSRAYVLYGDQEYKDRFYAVTEESNKLQEYVLAETNSSDLATYIQMSIRWKDIVEEKVFANYENGNKKLAEAVLKNEVQPIAHELMKGFKDVMALQQEEKLKATVLELEEEASVVQTTVFFLTIVAIALSVVIAYVIANRIVNPIRQVVGRVQEVADGNLQGEALITTSQDELGLLTTAVNGMVVQLRGLVQQVNHSMEQVTLSSQQLAATAEESTRATEEVTMAMQEVASGAQRQLEGVSRSSQSIDELATGIRRIVESTHVVSGATSKTSAATRSGSSSIESAIEQMSTINSSVQQSTEIVEQLNERSNEIGKMVDYINDISNQTNLLALNAEIEAARAGEHGRGFQVVAGEVRKLARQSQELTAQINEIIQKIRMDTTSTVSAMGHVTQEVNRGVSVVNDAGLSFNRILHSVEEVVKQVQEVSAVSEQMATNADGMKNIVHNNHKIATDSSAMSQTVAASAEEQMAAMEEIAASADTLQLLSSELKDTLRRFSI